MTELRWGVGGQVPEHPGGEGEWKSSIALSFSFVLLHSVLRQSYSLSNDRATTAIQAPLEQREQNLPHSEQLCTQEVRANPRHFLPPCLPACLDPGTE